MFRLAYFLKIFVISFLFSEVLCLAKCKYTIYNMYIFYSDIMQLEVRPHKRKSAVTVLDA